MGFFSRLFGSGNNSGGNSGGAPSGILRTVRSGGLDKADVLTAVDMLNSEILFLEEALEAKKNGQSVTIPPESELPEMRQVKMGGFNEEDVTASISELRSKISELRAQL